MEVLFVTSQKPADKEQSLYGDISYLTLFIKQLEL